MNKNTRYIFVDSKNDIIAEIAKEVLGGKTVIRFQIDTNVKIIMAESTEIREALFLGIDRQFARYYYNQSENAANVFSPRDSVGVQIFSYHMN